MHNKKPDDSCRRAGWGDDGGGEALNPDYDPELYVHLSAATRRNLGRVDEHRIDFDMLEELIVHIDENYDEGAVLVFLPGEGPVRGPSPHCLADLLPMLAGMGEISSVYERLAGSFRFRGEAASWVLPLHSTVSPEDQRRAFAKPPPGQSPIPSASQRPCGPRQGSHRAKGPPEPCHMGNRGS